MLVCAIQSVWWQKISTNLCRHQQNLAGNSMDVLKDKDRRLMKKEAKDSAWKHACKDYSMGSWGEWCYSGTMTNTVSASWWRPTSRVIRQIGFMLVVFLLKTLNSYITIRKNITWTQSNWRTFYIMHDP